MTSGIANPSACGHAITSTVTVRSTASSAVPIASHVKNVIDRGGRRHVEEERRGAIGERLRARARRLGFRDEPLDTGQRSAVADRSDLQANRGIGGDRARHDAITRALRHGA